MTVLNVGAYVGLYTALAKHLTGTDGTVVAIEPHAESRRFLELTVQANAATKTSVHVFDCAASDREGPAELFVNPQNKAEPFMQPDIQSEQPRRLGLDSKAADTSGPSVDDRFPSTAAGLH